MNFSFTSEQQQLRASVRRFLAAKSPEAEVRRLMESADGYDSVIWDQMAQLGLQGLIIPERFGGSGSTYIDLIVVLEEMGRALLGGPFFATVALAANLLIATGDEAAMADYLPAIADGSTIATVALAEAPGQWGEDGVGASAVSRGGRWLLSGDKHYVLDGHIADLILVAARTPAGIGVFAVEKGTSGWSADPLATMDQTRKQSRLIFDASPARLIGADGAGWAALAKALNQALVALAAEQVGGAQRVLEMAVEYAKIRVQFQRPIGSFQAIKHKCADLLLAVESAKSAAYYAGWAAAEDSTDLPLLASFAKASCSDAYFHAAAENIQIHGGIGFTWEHPAHLYFKRAKSSELLFGAPAYHRELIAQHIGI
jgi:alkylation response protein AidB-like acyl-CoA dehydrogenase